MPRVRPLVPNTLTALIFGAAAIQGKNDADLAEVVGVTRSTFNLKKSDLLNKLSYEQVMKLCRFLNISKEQVYSALVLRSEKQ